MASTKVTKVKKVVKQPAVKTVKKDAMKEVVKSTVSSPIKTDSKNISIDVYDLSGKVSGKISVSAAIFGEKVNKTLLAQAVRVYLANKRQGNASTKTRSEVDGSSRKIYRQKGTGKARHGTLRAPIFVKGGIVHGPKPRDFGLDFPKKMRRKALFSALSGKLVDGEMKIVSGFEKIEGKTKKFIAVAQKFDLTKKKTKVLVVAPDSFKNLIRATNNVQGVSFTAPNRLNAYEVMKNRNVLFTKEAILDLEKLYIGEK